MTIVDGFVDKRMKIRNDLDELSCRLDGVFAGDVFSYRSQGGCVVCLKLLDGSEHGNAALLETGGLITLPGDLPCTRYPRAYVSLNVFDSEKFHEK